MPLYEYRCDNCGLFEQWRSMAEVANPMHCPTCDQLAKRIFSPPSIKLSSSLRLSDAAEPTRVTRSQEPTPPRIHSHAHGRPWMISH